MAEYTKPDIIFITETKITSDIKLCEFLPDNYSGTIRKDRTKDGGGVMIATRKDLDIVEIDLCENTAECVWAKILIRGQDPILAGCFYRTNSEHTINQMEELEKTLNHVQETHNPNLQIHRHAERRPWCTKWLGNIVGNEIQCEEMQHYDNIQ